MPLLNELTMKMFDFNTSEMLKEPLDRLPTGSYLELGIINYKWLILSPKK